MKAHARLGGRACLAALAAVFALASGCFMPVAASAAGNEPVASDASVELVLQDGHTEEIHALEYAPNGQFFASGGKDSTIKLWWPNGMLIRTIPTGFWVDALTISHDSQAILAAALTGEIRLLSLDGRVLRRFPRLSLKLGLVKSLALSPDGRYFTRQIINALSARKAGTDSDGQVSIAELQDYVTLNVTLQTAGLQRPTIDRDNISQRFTLPLLH